MAAGDVLLYIADDTYDLGMGGAYKARLLTDDLLNNADFDPSTGTFSVDDVLMSASTIEDDAEEVCAINAAEEGKTSHELTPATMNQHFFSAHLVPGVDTSGRRCFMIGSASKRAVPSGAMIVTLDPAPASPDYDIYSYGDVPGGSGVTPLFLAADVSFHTISEGQRVVGTSATVYDAKIGIGMVDPDHPDKFLLIWADETYKSTVCSPP
jgi:hypothetical protein